MPGRGQPAERFGAGLLEMNVDYGGGITLYAGHGSVATPAPSRRSASRTSATVRRGGPTSWHRPPLPCGQGTTSVLRRRASSPSLPTPSSGGTSTPARWCADPTARPCTPVTSCARPTSPTPSTSSASRATGSSTPASWPSGSRRTPSPAGAHHGGRPRGIPGGGPHPTAAEGRRLGLATNPPPSVGGPMLAVMLGELASRPGREWADVIDIQRHVLSYRRHVHDLSQDLEEDGYALLEKVQRHGLPDCRPRRRRPTSRRSTATARPARSPPPVATGPARPCPARA